MNSVFAVRKNKNFGRHLVAVKDFEEGDMIYEEKPLLVFPNFQNATELPDDMVICLGCFMVFEEEDTVSCELCEWPCCSKKCATDYFHRNFECRYFVSNRVMYSRQKLWLVAFVRCILLWKRLGPDWAAFWNLSPDFGEPVLELEDQIKEITEACIIFIQFELNIAVDQGMIRSIVSRMLINSISTVERDKSDISYAGQVIFKNSSLLANSCCPNVYYSPPYSPSGRDKIGKRRDPRWKIKFYAKTNITAGDNLTIAYVQKQMEHGMMERQTSLFEHFYFICKCERCKDPTEKSTFFSALKCNQKNCTGSLVPGKPQDWNTDWICNECGYRKAVTEVEEEEERYDDDLVKILDSTRFDHRKRVDKLHPFIDLGTTVYGLHPNHNLVMLATQHYIVAHDLENLVEAGPEVDKSYKHLTDRLYKALRVTKIFGTTATRSTLEATAAMAIIRYVFKSPDYETIGHDDSCAEDKLFALEIIVKHLKTALQLMDRLPDTPNTFVMHEMIKRRFEIWNTRHTVLKTKMADLAFENNVLARRKIRVTEAKTGIQAKISKTEQASSKNGGSFTEILFSKGSAMFKKATDVAIKLAGKFNPTRKLASENEIDEEPFVVATNDEGGRHTADARNQEMYKAPDTEHKRRKSKTKKKGNRHGHTKTIKRLYPRSSTTMKERMNNASSTTASDDENEALSVYFKVENEEIAKPLNKDSIAINRKYVKPVFAVPKAPSMKKYLGKIKRRSNKVRDTNDILFNNEKQIKRSIKTTKPKPRSKKVNHQQQKVNYQQQKVNYQQQKVNYQQQKVNYQQQFQPQYPNIQDISQLPSASVPSPLTKNKVAANKKTKAKKGKRKAEQHSTSSGEEVNYQQEKVNYQQQKVNYQQQFQQQYPSIQDISQLPSASVPSPLTKNKDAANKKTKAKKGNRKAEQHSTSGEEEEYLQKEDDVRKWVAQTRSKKQKKKLKKPKKIIRPGWRL